MPLSSPTYAAFIPHSSAGSNGDVLSPLVTSDEEDEEEEGEDSGARGGLRQRLPTPRCVAWDLVSLG